MPGTITPIGVGSAQTYDRQTTAGVPLDFLVDPGNANPPVIFEPPPILTGGSAEVWLVTTGGPNWGGAQVWISLSGDSYALAGTVWRGARQGVLEQTLAAGADPDTVNTLSIDLTMSQGQLLSGTQADADSYVTLCYVDGELLSYATATLTALYEYDLTYLRRGAYGTAITSHALGSQFARFGPNDPSLLRHLYTPSLVGQTIHIKLISFNTFGQALQSLDEVTAYTYTLTGNGSSADTGIEVPGSQSGATLANMVVGRYVFCSATTFPSNFSGSRAVAGTVAAAPATYTWKKNGSTVGTLVYGAGQTVGVLATSGGAAVSFAPGDLLTLHAPASPDATLRDIGWNLLGINAGVPEVHGSQSGPTIASLVIGRWIAGNPVTFPAALFGARAVAGTAATAQTTYSVRRNGVQFGTMVFGAAQTVATFTGSETGFAVGDVLTIVAPASPDTTLKDIAWGIPAGAVSIDTHALVEGAMSGPPLAGVVYERHVFARGMTLLPSLIATGGVRWSYLELPPSAGEPIIRETFDRLMIIPANFAGSVCNAGRGATAEAIFDVAKNGGDFGTMTFAAGASVATFSGPETTFLADDVLTINRRGYDLTLGLISGVLSEKLAGSSVSVAAAGTPGTKSVSFDLRRNSVTVGAMSFAGGATMADFSIGFPVSFVPGDVLTIVGRGSDPTLRGLTWAIAGTR